MNFAINCHAFIKSKLIHLMSPFSARSAHELKTSMYIMGETMSQEDVDFMIRTADRDGDGLINYEGM